MVKRRKFIRAVSYLLALCVAVGAAGVFSGRAKASYEATLGKVRFEALASLCEYVHELSGGLSLLVVSQGDAVVDSLGYIGARAAGAMGCTACFKRENTANINRFLNSVYELSQTFSGNGQSRKAASAFSDYAEELYHHLSDVYSAAAGGEYSLVEYGSIYLSENKPYFEDYLDFSNGGEDELFSRVEDVYAGGGHFAVLSGEETVSLDFAKEKASRLIGIDEVLWREGEAKQTNGFEIYSLVHGDTEIEITRSGGRLCKLINPMPCSQAVYSGKDALSVAKEFVSEQGCNATELIAVKINPFTADFSFAPVVNGIMLITATVKVSVCLVSREIIFFDATEFIKNYRENIAVNDSVPDLRNVLSDELNILKTAVCFAEADGRERLCYLAICQYESEYLWVYIDYSSLRVIKMQKISFTDLN